MMKKIAEERGRTDGEVILYELEDGSLKVYRDIPGTGIERDVGSELFGAESFDRALRRFEELAGLLRRMNAGGFRGRPR